MNHVKRGYDAISFLASLNADRLLFVLAIAAALVMGGYVASL